MLDSRDYYIHVYKKQRTRDALDTHSQICVITLLHGKWWLLPCSKKLLSAIDCGAWSLQKKEEKSGFAHGPTRLLRRGQAHHVLWMRSITSKDSKGRDHVRAFDHAIPHIADAKRRVQCIWERVHTERKRWKRRRRIVWVGWIHGARWSEQGHAICGKEGET